MPVRGLASGETLRTPRDGWPDRKIPQRNNAILLGGAIASLNLAHRFTAGHGILINIS